MSAETNRASAFSTMTADEKKNLVERFTKYINRGQVRYLRAGHLDVIETRRQGVRFVDPLPGKAMFDCFSSAGCFNVGRGNTQIVEALDQAADSLDMGEWNLLSEEKITFARKLVDLAPGDLNRILFAAGGGDAVDAAIKMVRGATGKTKILSTVKAYHGHTGFALSANGKEHYRNYCEPLMPGFEFVPFNDLKAMEDAVDDDTASIIVEPVQGEAGIYIGSNDYLQGLRKLCDQRGILLIFDEIQTGFGRTGKLFACQWSGVVPDILTVAKSLGGGVYPNASVLYRGDGPLGTFVDANPDFHPSSTGGSDLGCRVSSAVLDYIVENKLWENAEQRGRRFREALLEMKRQNPKIIKDIRGIGLMVGIEYIHEFLGPMMADALAKHGVFAAYSGNAPQVMRFMAPITISEEELEELIEAISGALKDMKTLLPLALPAAKIPALLRLLNSEAVQTRLFGAMRSMEDGVKKLTDSFKGN